MLKIWPKYFRSIYASGNISGMKKWGPSLILLLIVGAVLYGIQYAGNSGDSNTAQSYPGDQPSPGNSDKSYSGKKLIYTKHAKCRMDCRTIDRQEVAEVLSKGRINTRKSNPNDPRCPTKAIEHRTTTGQLIRAVVADCDDVAKLVTVIDLENHYQCSCK